MRSVCFDGPAINRQSFALGVGAASMLCQHCLLPISASGAGRRLLPGGLSAVMERRISKGRRSSISFVRLIEPVETRTYVSPEDRVAVFDQGRHALGGNTPCIHKWYYCLEARPTR